MTARLANALTEIASQAPEIPTRDDLWQRGRRRRRGRRVRAAALSCLAAVLAGVLLVVPGRAPAQHIGDGGLTLPASVAEPYLWQPKVSASPNGPAMLVFTTQRSINLESAYVVVGRDGSYRIVYESPSDDVGSLSPDGRYLLGTALLDLETGRKRAIPLDLRYADWFWAPDSRHAVGITRHDPTVPAYGTDGQPISDSGHLSDIVVDDVQTGVSRVLAVRDIADPMVAVAPDGTRVAVVTGWFDSPHRLLILDLGTGRVLLDNLLADDLTLAGPAAWTPDSSQLLLGGSVATQSCDSAPCRNNRPTGAGLPWRVQRISAASGVVVEDGAFTVTGVRGVIGWRGGAPVVQVYVDTTCHLAVVTGSGTEQELPLRTPGGRCAAIPADILDQANFGGPGIGPAFWPAQPWFYGLLACGAAVVILAALLVGRRLRRRKAPRRADRVGPPTAGSARVA